MSNDPAAARFALLAAIRFGGAALAILGAVVIARRLVEPADLIGTALMVIGAFETLLLPRLLARRWKTK